MKCLLSFLLLFALPQMRVSAQNYSCISPEYKTWFTNSNGYLKGMRIDAVQTNGQYKIHYPFRTARVRAQNGLYADTMGGSWLGKAIIESIDGSVTYILNKWGDTIVLKNNASKDESWTLYHDTSSIYIKATAVALDTMTIGNVFDSAKTIRLTVMNGNTVLSDDSLNNLELILSKNHGFFQAIELYLLPFHEPGTQTYEQEVDMFMDEYLGMWSHDFTGTKLIFRRVNYKPPTERSIYDYNSGDVVITRRFDDFVDNSIYRDDRDSAIARVDMADFTKIDFFNSYYGVRKKSWYELEGYSGSRSYEIVYDDTPLIDTLKMPEEWFSDEFQYFFENDTSFCHTSNVYLYYHHFLRDYGQIYQFEDSRNSYSFKDGMGLLDRNYISYPAEMKEHTYLRGARKNGQLCGPDNLPLSIGRTEKSAYSFDIYPNPADDHISVSTGQEHRFSIAVTDIAGRPLVLLVMLMMEKLVFLRLAWPQVFICCAW
jgi:hypothetical protein